MKIPISNYKTKTTNKNGYWLGNANNISTCIRKQFKKKKSLITKLEI